MDNSMKYLFYQAPAAWVTHSEATRTASAANESAQASDRAPKPSHNS